MFKDSKGRKYLYKDGANICPLSGNNVRETVPPPIPGTYSYIPESTNTDRGQANRSFFPSPTYSFIHFVILLLMW